MKFRMTLKDPDGIYDSVQDAATDIDQATGCGMVAAEDRISRAISSFVEFGEYVTIEFDTELRTAKVISR